MLKYLDKKYGIRKRFLVIPFWLNPNLVSFFGLISAIVAGALFYFGSFILGGIFVGLNGFFDILDGYMAKKRNRTKFGDFLDHTFDRISDVFILLGIAMSSAVPLMLGMLTIIVVLLVSYLGTQFQAVTNKRLYAGVLCRADRILLLMFAGLLAHFFESVMYYCILIILILSIITFVQRFVLIYKKIRRC